MLLPDWITTTQTALTVRLTNKQQLGRAYTMRVIASLPQDPDQRTIKQTFQLNVRNPCNNGNRVIWTSADKEAKTTAQIVIMSIWTNKVISLNDLFTTTETTEDFGTCVTTP